jgi:hypothetical protein
MQIEKLPASFHASNYNLLWQVLTVGSSQLGISQLEPIKSQLNSREYKPRNAKRTVEKNSTGMHIKVVSAYIL